LRLGARRTSCQRLSTSDRARRDELRILGEAAAAAVTTASKSLRDLRVAEISELDLQLEGGKVSAYRAKVKVSFKYGGKD